MLHRETIWVLSAAEGACAITKIVVLECSLDYRSLMTVLLHFKVDTSFYFL